jgi:hypothetical protein
MLGGGLVLFGLIQLVPYGWSKTNPPVSAAAPWPNARAEAIARTSCYDCHSNETTWPAYSYVAPMSWLVRHDVDEGREEMNFSEWGRRSAHAAGKGREVIAEGEMPPSKYTLIHRDTKLTASDASVLSAALDQMSDGSRGGDDDRSGHD